MAAEEKTIRPVKGVQRDLSEFYISELNALFIKNLTTDHNRNKREGQEGENELLFTKLESNKPYSNLKFPVGQNYCIGYYHSWKTQEGYVWVWNSHQDHFIYVIESDGTCQVVYQNKCLNLQLDPKHFIRDGRVDVKVTCYFDKRLGKTVTRTFIEFTDDYNEQRMICKEDSIATHFYDGVQFPNLLVNDDLFIPCELITLAVQPPLKCITITPNTGSDDPENQNNLTYKALQFRMRYIDVWGRQSEWGPISDQYISVIGNACISESSGLPRCIALNLPMGGPQVEKVQLAIRRCSGNVRGLATETDWYLYDTIDKWDNYQKLNWWERNINPAIVDQFSPDTNLLAYKFCNNKECIPVDVGETNRVTNPQPQTSGTLFGIGAGIGLGKNKRGFQPMDPKELTKLDFTVNPPVGSVCNFTKTRKIRVWGVIYNPFEDGIQLLRSSDNRNVFGVADCVKNNPFAYDQVLPQDSAGINQEGIIGCLRGTSYYAISRQFRYDVQTGELVEVGIDFFQGGVNQILFRLKYLAIQIWDFEVLPGTYIFQVASHKSLPTDDYQKTSTYTIGQTNLGGLGQLPFGQKKEIVIGACDGDVEIKDHPIMIYDLTRIGKGCAVVDASSVNAGYIYEDEVEKRPIEMAEVSPNFGPFGVFYTRYTDHNGFYFAACRSRGLTTTINGIKNCVPSQFLAKGSTSLDTAANWYKFDKLYAYHGLTPYPVSDRYEARLQVTLCDNPSVGVAGCLIVLTNGGYAVTDNNGFATVLIHDQGDSFGTRLENLIISQRGVCHLINCGNACNFCFFTMPVHAPACNGSNPRIVTITSVPQVTIRGLNKKGPAMGGRYGGGITVHYRYGRKTFIQSLEKHYFDIPGIQTTQVFDYCSVGWALDPTVDFGPDVVGFNFNITENLNWNDSLTWVAERIQLVDATGNLNSAAPTQIRLYYEGLNEYNVQHELSTTTIWEFITSGKGVTGDRVEFLVNGDNTFFGTKITALVKYDKEGRYIQVDYTSELSGLKDGCLVKLIRPKQCEQKEWYYSLCPVIRVIDGKPETFSGTLNFYDSYLLNRQIPIPVEVKQKSKDAQGNEIITSVTENKLTSYAFLFEHHSPSDFWGDHCHSKGEPNVKNPYEKQTCNREEIALSTAFGEDSNFNGLSYFEDSDVYSFIGDWGAINLIFVEGSTVLLVCENDCVAVGYDDNRIRIAKDGSVEAISLPNRLGKPQKSGGVRFGCDPRDLNTICRYGGQVVFLDRNNATVVLHNLSTAIDLAGKMKIVSYITMKIKELVTFNNFHGEIKYFHGCIDVNTGKYLLSSSELIAPDSAYINDELDITLDRHETMVFDIHAMAFDGWTSFTPEYMGALGSETTDKQFFSFKNGQAWSHYNDQDSFNNFFGVQCNNVIEIACSIDKGTCRFMWMEVYCKEQYFNADKIVTQSGQVSRIMKSWFERYNKFTSADFKCAINTPPDNNLVRETGELALTDGDTLYGQWIRIRLVGEESRKGEYIELNSVNVNYISENSESR